MIDSPFTLEGEYRHASEPLQVHFHALLDLNERYLPPILDDTDPNHEVHTRQVYSKVKVDTHPPDHDVLRPFFLNVPSKVVKKTLEATTQYARHIHTGPNMFKTYRTPFPACNVLRRHEAVATDTVHSDVAAVDTNGVSCAQIFVGRESLVVDIYGMKTDKQFVNTFLEVIRKRGAMDTLISDSAASETSARVIDILRHLMINSWQSEPYFQHQNFCERRWQDVKRLTNWVMQYKGVAPDCWLLCLEYVADIMNITAVQSLHWRTPIEKLTGQTPDTSIAMVFQFYDPVYYQMDRPTFPSGTTEKRGRFVGFAKDVGHAMTYKVLSDDSRKVLCRSLVRRIDEQPNLRLDPDAPLPPTPTFFRSTYEDLLQEGSQISMPTISPVHHDDVYKTGESDDEDGESESPPPLRVRTVQDEDEDDDDDGDNPEGDRPTRFAKSKTIPSEPGEPKHGQPFNGEPIDIGRSVLLPKEINGQRFRAKVLVRVDDFKKGLEKERYENAKYRVLVGHDGGKQWEDLVCYNDMVNFINDDDGNDGLWRFKEIQAHQGPLTSSDENYLGCRWNVLVAWETGEITWEPLKSVEHDKVLCGLYARKNNLLDQPGWAKFKRYAKREKKLLRMVNQAKLHSFRTAPVYMFGHLVPRNHDQAIEIDLKNGNTRWQDAEREELFAILGYGTFNSKGKDGTPPPGHKKITVHFVYAVKHDGRYKARLVAGGHLTDTPIDSVYSSVASLRGVRMIMFLAELNDLKSWTTDIGNAYLESHTLEKVYIIAGKEFACVGLEGHVLVIVKSLYGLKSSGARWWEVLADVLRQMGFKPSKADRDIWMRDKGDHYEYVVVYVDDLWLASKLPEELAQDLEKRFGFKLKGTGPTSFHLGADYFRDAHGTMCMAPKRYIDKMIEAYVRMFGSKPKQYATPLEHGDHPEMDTSMELDLDDIKKFQSMIGALQWVVQIGRFDITTAVMTLSSFRTNPRVGHLDRCKRIYGYLSKMRNAAIRVRIGEPDYSALPTKEYDWEQSVYSGAEELIPHDIPRVLGKPVVMTTFVDANLYHDLITGRSVTGILHLFNQTVVDWFSKKQATVETATYGSEFVAACTAMEQIIDLRIQLRYLGVEVKGSTLMFGDNESVVNSASIPHARLHKRHNALSFHRVHEGIAAGIAEFHHVRSGDNPADILSKQWGYAQSWSLLQPLLFWEGDTMELVKEET